MKGETSAKQRRGKKDASGVWAQERADGQRSVGTRAGRWPAECKRRAEAREGRRQRSESYEKQAGGQRSVGTKNRGKWNEMSHQRSVNEEQRRMK